MALALYYCGCPSSLKWNLPIVKAVNVSETGSLRLPILERVDEELRRGNEREALALVNNLVGKPGGLRCFGTARQVVFSSSSCLSH